MRFFFGKPSPVRLLNKTEIAVRKLPQRTNVELLGRAGMRQNLSSRFLILIGGVALLFSAMPPKSCGGQSDSAAQSVDKSQYNVFNPTPCGQLRDFAPDRPDQTEGPFTADAGHGGLAYSINDNVILDGGINAGVTRTAQDWQPFAGISFRF
jgi:hypothetical protein